MKLAIFGGTGRAGGALLGAALADGHVVNAFVRDPSRLGSTRSHVRVFEGSLDDRHTVAEAIDGTDAVLSTLSAGRGVLTTFGEAVISPMLSHGPRRIVALVGASLRLPGDPDTLSLRAMTTMMRLVPGRMLDDAGGFAAQLKASGLMWTLVRSANFANRPGGAPVRSAPSFAMRLDAQIAVTDLAAFMLSLVTNNWYAASAPMVQNA